MFKKRFKILIPIVYLLFIVFSYILWAFISDSENRPLGSNGSSRYLIKENTASNIVDSLIELTKIDTAYTTAFNSKTKKFEHFDPISYQSEQDEIWIIQLNIKKYDLKFLFRIIGRSTNSIDLIEYSTKTEDILTSSLESNLFERLKIQNIFEQEILNKVCDYEKSTIIQITSWYSLFFFENQLLFIEILVLLIILTSAYQCFITKNWKKLVICITLLLFVGSNFLTFANVVNDDMFNSNNEIYLIYIIFDAFIHFNLFSIIVYIICAIYITTLIEYFVNIKIKILFIQIILLIVLSIHLSILNYTIPVNYLEFENSVHSAVISFSIGYYLWVASFVVLLIGMLLTRRIKDKIDA